MLHHVIGEHEWSTGHCYHSDLTADDDADLAKKPLEVNSASMKFLRHVVLDPTVAHFSVILSKMQVNSSYCIGGIT